MASLQTFGVFIQLAGIWSDTYSTAQDTHMQCNAHKHTQAHMHMVHRIHTCKVMHTSTCSTGQMHRHVHAKHSHTHILHRMQAHTRSAMHTNTHAAQDKCTHMCTQNNLECTLCTRRTRTHAVPCTHAPSAHIHTKTCESTRCPHLNINLVVDHLNVVSK